MINKGYKTEIKPNKNLNKEIDRDLNASINLKNYGESHRKKPVDIEPLHFGMVQNASLVGEAGINEYQVVILGNY